MHVIRMSDTGWSFFNKLPSDEIFILIFQHDLQEAMLYTLQQSKLAKSMAFSLTTIRLILLKIYVFYTNSSKKMLQPHIFADTNAVSIDANEKSALLMLVNAEQIKPSL